MSLKLSLSAVILFITSFFLSTYFFHVNATQGCTPVDTYVTKTSDSTADIVNFDFNGNETSVSISADSGYTITEVWLDVDDDGHAGYYQYGTSAGSYNPNPGDEINSAKVRVIRVCPTPTPTPTPSPTPTPTPTAIPTPTPEVTPTPEPTPEATPTPEPTVSPEPSATPSATPEPPREEVKHMPTATSCAADVPGDVANIYVDQGIPNDGKLEVRWLNARPNEGARHAHILYTDGNPGEWKYALLNTENDGTEVIGELKNGTHYWFTVALVNDCAVGNLSNAFDPMP